MKSQIFKSLVLSAAVVTIGLMSAGAMAEEMKNAQGYYMHGTNVSYTQTQYDADLARYNAPGTNKTNFLNSNPNFAAIAGKYTTIKPAVSGAALESLAAQAASMNGVEGAMAIAGNTPDNAAAAVEEAKDLVTQETHAAAAIYEESVAKQAEINAAAGKTTAGGLNLGKALKRAITPPKKITLNDVQRAATVGAALTNSKAGLKLAQNIGVANGAITTGKNVMGAIQNGTAQTAFTNRVGQFTGQVQGSIDSLGNRYTSFGSPTLGSPITGGSFTNPFKSANGTYNLGSVTKGSTFLAGAGSAIGINTNGLSKFAQNAAVLNYGIGTGKNVMGAIQNGTAQTAFTNRVGQFTGGVNESIRMVGQNGRYGFPTFGGYGSASIAPIGQVESPVVTPLNLGPAKPLDVKPVAPVAPVVLTPIAPTT